MTGSETTATFDERFIELVELLLEQHVATESRREAAHKDQMGLLELVQSQIESLAKVVETLSESTQKLANAAASPGADGKTSGNPAGAEADDSLSEWERQKRLLLKGLGEPDPGPSKPVASTSQPGAASSVAAASALPVETTSHDWIEHLDPNDPALSDDAERRELVARLRKFEVELSLERAKLARERTELELQKSELEQTRKQQANDLANSGADGKKDASRPDRMQRFINPKKK